MSTNIPDDRTAATAVVALPSLSDERIDSIERSVFDGIQADGRRARARRGRWIGVGAAAAAVVVAAAVLTPAMPGLLGITPSDTSAVAPVSNPEQENPSVGVTENDVATGDGATDSPGWSMPDAGGGKLESAVNPDKTGVFGEQRDIVVTGSATLTVGDISGAAALLADAAEARGGNVESMSVGSNEPIVMPLEDGKVISSGPAQSYGWVTVKVPAGELTALIADLDGIGDVTALSTDRSDVTSYALDLKARTDAARASVERLQELIAGASSVSDLIEADVALSERQAMLESYEQQLAQLKSEVAMSTLSVNLTLAAAPTSANPAGFGDGVATGWNAVVASLNALVVSLGFLIPWIAVVAVLGAVIWGIVTLVRRARRTGRERRASQQL